MENTNMSPSSPLPSIVAPTAPDSAIPARDGPMQAAAANSPSGPDTQAAAPKKLSGAELKKLKQAEKAAKRAAKKSEATPPPIQQPGEQPGKQKRQLQPQQEHGGSKSAGQASSLKISAKSTQASRRASVSAPAPAAPPSGPKKRVGLFGHLYGNARRHTIENAPKEVHPSVLALGLQMSSYEVCGSTARCVGMLQAFKSVIKSYTTPQGTSLARHLTAHHLSPQIEFLKACRPISISMGNSIRFLKDQIIKIDPSVPEPIAKRTLVAAIDTFLHERISAADTVIAQAASARILPGETILTFAKSSLVLKTLLAAHNAGTSFNVIVLDSKPLFEGRRMAKDLAAAGIPTQYMPISAASHAVAEANRIFLGAHAMMANGRLFSRVGTAIVAMHAHEHDVPVIVCCQSVKFTDRVALDSIVGNEVAPADELLGYIGGGPAREQLLKTWTETPGLQVLNILYDVTPAEYVKLVVTEYGSLPPSSVPAVLRILETAQLGM